MAAAKERRKVEVLRKGKWVVVKSITEVKKGESFRLFEPDGTPVTALGRTEFVALNKGYKTKGVGSIDIAKDGEGK